MAGPGDDELSPLQEIEHTVQARARDLSLDLADHDDTATLRRLVEEAVAQWSTDHARGLRPYDLADPALVTARAIRNLTAYGPLTPLLADDDVWEVMINGPADICRGSVA